MCALFSPEILQAGAEGVKNQELIHKLFVCMCAGPNAISVSMSPSNQYVMVGLASKRMMWAQVTDQVRSSRAVVPVSVMVVGTGVGWCVWMCVAVGGEGGGHFGCTVCF